MKFGTRVRYRSTKAENCENPLPVKSKMADCDDVESTLWGVCVLIVHIMGHIGDEIWSSTVVTITVDFLLVALLFG